MNGGGKRRVKCTVMVIAQSQRLGSRGAFGSRVLPWLSPYARALGLRKLGFGCAHNYSRAACASDRTGIPLGGRRPIVDQLGPQSPEEQGLPNQNNPGNPGLPGVRTVHE